MVGEPSKARLGGGPRLATHKATPQPSTHHTQEGWKQEQVCELVPHVVLLGMPTREAWVGGTRGW